MKKIMIKQRVGAWVASKDVAPDVILCILITLFAVIGSFIFFNATQNERRGAPELRERSVVIAAQLSAPDPTPTPTLTSRQELPICAIETETEVSGAQTEIERGQTEIPEAQTEVEGVQTEIAGVSVETTTPFSYTLYVPLMICPEALPLPAACYTATALFARQQCLLELDTSYVISFTAWQHSDLFIGFPIAQQIHAVVDNYSEPAADVDLRFWGENSQGSNVPGPFHPAAPGGPINATWTPVYPYRTPGIYLVELFAYTPYDFTVRLRVEKE